MTDTAYLGPGYVVGTGFSPLDIPNCMLWLEADYGVTVDGNNNVNTWEDRSGYSRNASNSTEGDRPAYTTNQINGHPAITSAGSKILYTAAFTMSSVFTVFSIFKSTTTGVHLVYELSVNSNSNPGFFLGTSTGSTVSESAGGVKCTRDATANWANDSNYHLVRVQSNGTAAGYTLAKDGGNVSLTTTGNYDVGLSDITNQALYIMGRSTKAFSVVGGIVLLVIYNRVITSPESTSFTTYYGNKYGITLS